MPEVGQPATRRRFRSTPRTVAAAMVGITATGWRSRSRFRGTITPPSPAWSHWDRKPGGGGGLFACSRRFFW